MEDRVQSIKHEIYEQWLWQAGLLPGILASRMTQNLETQENYLIKRQSLDMHSFSQLMQVPACSL